MYCTYICLCIIVTCIPCHNSAFVWMSPLDTIKELNWIWKCIRIDTTITPPLKSSLMLLQQKMLGQEFYIRYQNGILDYE